VIIRTAGECVPVAERPGCVTLAKNRYTAFTFCRIDEKEACMLKTSLIPPVVSIPYTIPPCDGQTGRHMTTVALR